MADLNDLQQLVVRFRDERAWKQFHNPKDEAISLVLEAAEFLEHFQWKNEDEIRAHLETRSKEVSDELADVLYWVLLIANDLQIPLDDALASKMMQNQSKYPIEKAHGNHTKYTEL